MRPEPQYLEFDAFRDMLVGLTPPSLVPEHELLTGQQHQLWRTKEFHLYASSAAEYLKRIRDAEESTGNAPSALSQKLAILSTGPALNAFIPERTLFKEVPGGLEVYEPGKLGCLFYR